MKFNFKVKVLFLLFSFQIFPQTLYTKYIKKDQVLEVSIDKNFTWIFSFPFDMQYKTYKEGNFINFEGKNLGLEKIFIKTSAIKNQKNIDPLAFKNVFFQCKYPFMDLNIESIDLKNSLLSFFHICSDNFYYQLKSFIFYDNVIHVLYIIWVKELAEEEYERIRKFINSIQYKF